MAVSLKHKIDDKNSQDEPAVKKSCTDEEKILALVDTVMSQGFIGRLIIVLHDNTECSYVTLQNSVSYANISLEVFRDLSNHEDFELRLNGKMFAKGSYPNQQLAKNQLAEEVVKKLKETCFFITKKNDFVNVTKSIVDEKAIVPSSLNSNSIAHKMMMKMGWGGGGLGIQEQGNTDSIVLYENVNREGLGTSSNNLMREITKKLENFAESSDVLTLVFDTSFTKEERALIHKIARKFNLKSKSTGTESRKLTVSKKLTRLDVVKDLLRMGGEDGFYKLHIPSKFIHMWSN